VDNHVSILEEADSVLDVVDSLLFCCLMFSDSSLEIFASIVASVAASLIQTVSDHSIFIQACFLIPLRLYFIHELLAHHPMRSHFVLFHTVFICH
jgi:hypothetical protein